MTNFQTLFQSSPFHLELNVAPLISLLINFPTDPGGFLGILSSARSHRCLDDTEFFGHAFCSLNIGQKMYLTELQVKMIFVADQRQAKSKSVHFFKKK